MPEGLGRILAERLRRREPLARYTTLRIGGPADLLVTVGGEEELLTAVHWAGVRGLPFSVLGGGSNVLVSDAGARGLVIVNRAVRWNDLRVAADSPETSDATRGLIVEIGSSVPLSRLARRAAERGLGGLEWAIGIPGTLGGAIVGNAGAHGGCVADCLLAVRVLGPTGEVREEQAASLELSYRSSIFKERYSRICQPPVILSAMLALRRTDPKVLAETITGHLAQRRRTQPRGLSAGSIFRNPPGRSAGRLLEEAGLKGECMGNAQVSWKHANFIVNRGNASAADMARLISVCQERVSLRFGIDLQPEITFWGDWDTQTCEGPVLSDG